MRARLVAVAMALAATGAPAQDFAADAKAVPVSISFVQSGGHWEKGKDEGFYRIVVASGGFEHVISRLYIQWIATDQDSREYKLIRTLDVKELNGGGFSVLRPAPKFTDKGPWTVAVAVTRRDGKAENRIISVRPEGGYSIK